MDNVLSAISTVGFPIVAVIFLAWFVYQTSNKREAIYNRIADEFVSATKEFTRVVDEFRATIDGKLTTMEDDVKEIKQDIEELKNK